MPKKGREIPPPAPREVPELEPGMTYTQHWTRKEQIENALEADRFRQIFIDRGETDIPPESVAEIEPKLTAKEKKDHEIP